MGDEYGSHVRSPRGLALNACCPPTLVCMWVPREGKTRIQIFLLVSRLVMPLATGRHAVQVCIGPLVSCQERDPAKGLNFGCSYLLVLPPPRTKDLSLSLYNP